MKMKRHLGAVVAITALTALGAGPAAQAHEFRSLGQGYIVYVGSYVEPPFAGFENGVDIFPQYSYTADDASAETYFVDTSAGDTFTFTTSEILFSKNPLPIIHSAADIPSQTLIVNTLVAHGPVKPNPIKEKFGSANLAFSAFGPEYNNHFLPATPGYYAYHIAGKIQVKASNIAGNPNSQGVAGTSAAPPLVSFDQYFVCGAGSQNAPNTSFECFTQILPVPYPN